MAKYKVTISQITEYSETVTKWRDKTNPEKVYDSKYDIDDYSDNAVSHQKETGEMKEQSRQIYDQIITTDNERFVEQVVKTVNEI